MIPSTATRARELRRHGEGFFVSEAMVDEKSAEGSWAFCWNQKCHTLKTPDYIQSTQAFGSAWTTTVATNLQSLCYPSLHSIPIQQRRESDISHRPRLAKSRPSRSPSRIQLHPGRRTSLLNTYPIGPSIAFSPFLPGRTKPARRRIWKARARHKQA